MMCSFFWVIPRRLNFVCRRFGTLCFIFIGGVSRYSNWDKISREFTQVNIWLRQFLANPLPV
jgi:hypothetical protein